MKFAQLTDFALGLKGIAGLSPEGLTILDAERFRDEAADELVYTAVFSPFDEVREAARWIIWEAALVLGAVPASIQDLYVARGQEKYQDICVPAVNLRGLTYDSARAVFRAVESLNAGPFIFEIAKSEIGYTFQRPAEYVACILGAALKEGYAGPVLIQGDHFQVNLKNYKADPEREVAGVKAMIEEAVPAGFYNIDIDTSTLVDLERSTIEEQQRLNYEIGAELTRVVRESEPEGVTVSVGGEIGEVGGKNSTIEELVAYLDGYNETLERLLPAALGLSKISVQTGTSHGGVPLPDGTVAEVALDFGVLEDLGRVARDKYGLSGTVQHGASTLPDTAFHRFKECQASEVHLATGFQNIILDHDRFPADLKERVYGWLRINCTKERKEGQTDEQFYYKTRKKVFGPYKWETWTLPADVKTPIMADLEKKFRFLFDQLGLKDTAGIAKSYLDPPKVRREIPSALKVLLADPRLFGETLGAEEDAPGAD